MKLINVVFLIICIALVCKGCQFIGGALTYSEKTETFVNALIAEDYDRAMDYIVLESEGVKRPDVSVVKQKLAEIRRVIVNSFGTELEFTLVGATKVWSTNENESTPANTTQAEVQLSNGKEFGALVVLFDDASGKILNINKGSYFNQPVPNMIPFWMFGILAICVPVFNIYVIRKVAKSALKRKWLKYIAICVFNAPAIKYVAVTGFSMKILSFQVLLGFGFSLMGYMGSVWTFGIPLGGLYWLYKLSKNKEMMQPEEVIIPDGVIDIDPGPETQP